jgi:hypothetical protein
VAWRYLPLASEPTSQHNMRTGCPAARIRRQSLRAAAAARLPQRASTRAAPPPGDARPAASAEDLGGQARSTTAGPIPDLRGSAASATGLSAIAVRSLYHRDRTAGGSPSICSPTPPVPRLARGRRHPGRRLTRRTQLGTSGAPLRDRRGWLCLAAVAGGAGAPVQGPRPRAGARHGARRAARAAGRARSGSDVSTPPASREISDTMLRLFDVDIERGWVTSYPRSVGA